MPDLTSSNFFLFFVFCICFRFVVHNCCTINVPRRQSPLHANKFTRKNAGRKTALNPSYEFVLHGPNIKVEKMT